MARNKQHSLDRVAEDLAEWLERVSDEIVEALIEDGRSPFGAGASVGQRLGYYAEQLWLPDGQPNPEGRQRLLQQLGPDGYASVYRTVAQATGRAAAVPVDDQQQPDLSR